MSKRLAQAAAAATVIGLALSLPACGDDSSGARSGAAPTPHLSNAQRRVQFLRTVDESISGSALEGNPFRYVGKNVDLHCTVTSIPDPDFINADCGQNSLLSIVIVTSTRSLSQGQALRVLGTVADPQEGTNALGGTMKYPTVVAHYVQ